MAWLKPKFPTPADADAHAHYFRQYFNHQQEKSATTTAASQLRQLSRDDTFLELAVTWLDVSLDAIANYNSVRKVYQLIHGPVQIQLGQQVQKSQNYCVCGVVSRCT